MAIIISNLGGDPSTQIRRYEVRINQTVITHFTHDRDLGLALCLKKAAQAVADNDPTRILLEDPE